MFIIYCIHLHSRIFRMLAHKRFDIWQFRTFVHWLRPIQCCNKKSTCWAGSMGNQWIDKYTRIDASVSDRANTYNPDSGHWMIQWRFFMSHSLSSDFSIKCMECSVQIVYRVRTLNTTTIWSIFHRLTASTVNHVRCLTAVKEAIRVQFSSITSYRFASITTTDTIAQNHRANHKNFFSFLNVCLVVQVHVKVPCLRIPPNGHIQTSSLWHRS